jgi:hypothetical protein
VNHDGMEGRPGTTRRLRAPPHQPHAPPIGYQFGLCTLQRAKTELITVIHRERPPATTQSARRGLRFGSVRRPSVHAPPCPRRARRDSGRPAIAADPAGDRCDNRGGCHRLTGDAVPATRPGCLLDVLEDPLHRLQLPRMTTVWVKVSAGGSRCLLGAHRASGRKGSSGWAGARARRSPAGIT